MMQNVKKYVQNSTLHLTAGMRFATAHPNTFGDFTYSQNVSPYYSEILFLLVLISQKGIVNNINVKTTSLIS